MAKVEIDYTLCKVCGLCVYHCRRGALKIAEPGNEMAKGVEINQEICNGCTLCALMCPDAAITIYRR